MSATYFPPSTSELDAKFLFDGVYRSRPTLTLAERAAFGLRERSEQFKDRARRDVPHGAARECGAKPIAAAPCKLCPTRSRETPMRKPIARGSLVLANNSRRPEPIPRSQADPRRHKPLIDSRPIRFTARLGSVVLSGVVFESRIFTSLRFDQGWVAHEHR
jgi:hypothetical protein